MTQEQRSSDYTDEIILRDYVLIVLRNWWVVVAVFAIAVVVTLIYSASVNSTDIYEARAKVLLASDFPASVFFSLSQADNVLFDVVEDLDLRDEVAGDPWPVGRLAGMMHTEIEPLETTAPGSADRDRTIPTHMLTMTVRGSDSTQVKPISDSWAKVFLSESGKFFSAQASSSYGYALARYNDTLQDLENLESERATYLESNPLVSLKSRLSALTTQGGGAMAPRTFEVETVPPGRSLQQIVVELGNEEAPSIRGVYEEFLFQLSAKQPELLSAKARLRSVEQALAEEPQFVVLEQGLSPEAIAALLAGNPDRQLLQSLDKVVSVSQQPSQLYTSLKAERASLQSTIASLEAEIAYLGATTQEMQSEVEDLTFQIAAIELELARFDREIGFLEAGARQLARELQEEETPEGVQEPFMQVLESAIEPRSPIPPQGRRQTLLIAGVLGLILGVLAAFGLHYLREPQTERTTQERTDD